VFWQDHLSSEPGIRPYLTALARKAVRAGVMPRTATLGAVPAEPRVHRKLEFVFVGCAIRDGRIVVRLPERLRTPESLAALAACVGVAAPAPAPDLRGPLNTAVMRQGLLFPALAPVLGALAGEGELASLFRDEPSPETTLNGLLRAVAFLQANRSAITLSQLGAQALNDSKALRTGALRALLTRALARLADAVDDAPESVLARYGVVENPYTTTVLLYGPMIYEDAAGRTWDWPAQLHAAGQAAALTWEQVCRIRAIRFASPVDGVITSENAAPFHHLVETRSDALCIYTAGYPGAAVMRVLSLLSGLQAWHWGDTDLDGLRIAEWVSRAIPLELHRQDTATLDSYRDRLIPLTAAQRARAESYLAAHPDFRFRTTLEYTLASGWLEQEQMCLESRQV
jgi:hypothetical protein